MQLIKCILSDLVARKLRADQYGLDTCNLDKLIVYASAYHWIEENAPDCLSDLEQKIIDTWIKEHYNCYTASICGNVVQDTPCPGFSIELDEERSQFYRVNVTGGNSLFTYIWEWDDAQYSLRTGTATFSTLDLQYTGGGTPTTSTVKVTVVDNTKCRRTDSVLTECAPRAENTDAQLAVCNSNLVNSWNPFIIDLANKTKVCVNPIDWSTLNVITIPGMTVNTVGSVVTVTIDPGTPIGTYTLGWNVYDTAGNISNTASFGITLPNCI